MCGIVGYVGSREASTLLIDALKRLEYRGYDSCGIALMNGGAPQVVRSVGRISALEEKLRTSSIAIDGPMCGIGHTRWATHGQATEENAHPHRDCTGKFIVVHNGIIENHLELRRRLSAEGHSFRTATDTEVLPHLIESCFQGDLEQAVLAALKQAQGVFSIVVMSSHEPLTVIAVRNGPPLVIGVADGENFVASDIAALLPHTRRILLLNDGEIAVLRTQSAELHDFSGRATCRQPQLITWSTDIAERQGYPHFMLKEIFEQPHAIRNTIHGRLDTDDIVDLVQELKPLGALQAARRVVIAACGTSLHAGLIAKFMIEGLAQIPVEVDYASEFRYRHPLVDASTMTIAVTQSGETADTLGALRYARQKGAFSISICNVVGSMAARNSDCVLYTKAGPEIGVASTKAFTTQLVTLYLFSIFLARARGTMTDEEVRERIVMLKRVPDQMEQILASSDRIAALAEIFVPRTNALYLGRGVNYPIALEGALKLKEISYIHAEGYPAGEMKHGPIALIDAEMPVVVVAPQDALYAKTLSNLEEVKARGGIILAVASEHDTDIAGVADHVIRIPKADPFLNPLLAVVPLQLLSYYTAVRRGCDVDKPRNLAKSVTVE
jgi:glucosamine--fructose-6-phosphate aminotransferase (isomerizing)